MLKFDVLGCGPAVNPNGYASLLDEVEGKNCQCKLHLRDAGSASSGIDAVDTLGSCRVRHVGTGSVVEGHAALSSDDTTVITVANCKLTVSAEIERVIPKGATALDLSDLFSDLDSDDVTVTGVQAEDFSVSNGVITLDDPAATDVPVKVKFDIAVGDATTDNNAATVNLDAGDYQIHFVVRAHDDVEASGMPNPTTMSFVKHCRPLNIGV